MEKNKYPLLLISELLDKFQLTEVITEFELKPKRDQESYMISKEKYMKNFLAHPAWLFVPLHVHKSLFHSCDLYQHTPFEVTLFTSLDPAESS